MTNFSYSGDPDAGSRLDIVRLMIGDTDPDDPLLSDGEIGIALASSGVNTYAAAACADFIAAKFSRMATVKIGSTSINGAEKAKSYFALAKALRKGGPGDIPGGDGSGEPTLTMFAGGTSRSANAATREDPDRVQGSFAIGQDDFPGSSNVDADDEWRQR